MTLQLIDRLNLNSWVRVDDADQKYLEQSLWSNSNGYAKRYKEVSFDGKRVRWTEYLHRLIVDAHEGDIVDHINQDKSDNRRCNLRVVGKSENLLNTDKSRGYNVRYLLDGSIRYDVTVNYKNKRVLAKTFDNEAEAIKAYKTKKEEILNVL